MAATVPLELRSELDLSLQQELHKELLRFTTAGSVDDGKSTLIGRLLHDCKAVYEDQLDSVKKSRINRSGRAIDFSLLTDGLRAEREQGITIDVAYRYFSTARRKFIIADTPGHEQYTRNMATGASTADLAVILVDATKGLLAQTRRHTYIAALLGIDRVLAAVNKMDLVGHREEVFVKLEREFIVLAQDLGISAVQCIPISALDGDNVVKRSENTAWYAGPTLLEHLENVPVQPPREGDELRFPIQYVIRPDAGFRGFAGRVVSGRLQPGEEVLALPSQQRSRVESLVSFDGELEAAGVGQSVVVKLADEIDLSRGDQLVSPGAVPEISNRFAAMVVWLHAAPLQLNRTYLAKHAGRQVKVKATRIRYRVDVNQLIEEPAASLEMNEIACVEFETSQPLYFDGYRKNRTTGSLILIDPLSNATIGAVMIHENLPRQRENEIAADEYLDLQSRGPLVGAERRERRGHRPAILVLTGERPAAETIERSLFERGFESVSVDCDDVPVTGWRSLFSALVSLGVIVVAWSPDALGPRQHDLLAEIAGNSLFQLSADRDDADNARSLLTEAVRIAQTLRIEGRNHTQTES